MGQKINPIGLRLGQSWLGLNMVCKEEKILENI